MIYLIEFTILHSLFLVVYKLMLSRETQLTFLRSFLIGCTVLSLSIPAIHIPNVSTIPTVNTEAIILPSVSIMQPTEHADSLHWIQVLFLLVSVVITVKLLMTVYQLGKFYFKSHSSEIDNIPVREIEGLQSSFTFFKWIFIDTSYFENPGDVVRHEQGHAQKLHSIDLTFLYLLTIVCWWAPSIWLMIRELKKIHEYEADQYALSMSKETYVKTLVHSTLKAHGMNLASSFNDAPIFNRLNFIKQMKKKLNPWKIFSVSTILAISAAMFACEDELESEIKRIADESNQQIDYSDDVEAALAELKAENPDQQYSVFETKIENEESIKRLNAFKPEQIARIFLNEEGDEKSVVMILNKSSQLFQETVDLQLKDTSSDVFTITDEAASFDGGLDAFYQYLSSELKYPKQAQKLGVEGRVFVQFIIETDGTLSDLHVVKGIGAGCDAEAVRVLKNSPKWIPGKVNGEPVRQKMIQNLAFILPK